MKKFYLFLSFVIALAISAKADYYIVGDFTDNSWKPNVAQYTLTYESDGVYSTVANFKVGANGFTLIGKLDDKWENVTPRYQLDPYDPSLVESSTEMLTDKEILMKEGSANIFCNNVPAGYYKIIFNTNNMTLKFETIERTDYVYVAGGFAKNWLTQDPFVAAPETSKDSRIYKWYIDCENANDELKISTKLSQKVNEWSGEESFNAGVFALGGKETNGKPIFTTKNDGDWDKNLKLTSKGRYYFTLDLNENKLTVENSYQLHTWVVGGALNSLGNKKFDRIDANTCELTFESPIELASDEEFLLKGYDYFKGSTDAANSWTLKPNDGDDISLKAGKYYNAVVNDAADVTLKFNTYAKTTTGLDALLSKSADYVEIGTDIYVQAHHENYYLAYTTESSTYVAPNANQDTKYYGDDPAKFAKRDWVKIYAPGESDLVGKNIAAGTIIEVATGKAVKWGTVGSEATSFTPNLYRPLNFNATETDKDVMYIFQPQEGEVLQVRGKFAKVGDNEYLTDAKEEHKVALLGFTKSKMTEGQWYTLDGHVCDGAVYYTGFETATGVESVETANATVFAANGTINVSSEAQAAIEVYTANGQMVRAINADNASIAVAPGFYLVKVGNQVSKVIVK